MPGFAQVPQGTQGFLHVCRNAPLRAQEFTLRRGKIPCNFTATHLFSSRSRCCLCFCSCPSPLLCTCPFLCSGPCLSLRGRPCSFLSLRGGPCLCPCLSLRSGPCLSLCLCLSLR